MRLQQWEEFKRNLVFFDPGTLSEVMKTVNGFVMPAANDAILLSKKEVTNQSLLKERYRSFGNIGTEINDLIIGISEMHKHL